MLNIIDKFDGPHFFLSNFFPSQINIKGHFFPTVEHAYQASKADNFTDFLAIKKTTSAGKAKRLGQSVILKANWEEIKLQVMEDCLRKKFEIPKLKALLLETSPFELVEGNNWGDRFWGVDVEGENHLGKLLMKIRAEHENKIS